MKTYFVKVQRPCGKRANPLNYVSKYVVSAETQYDAETFALRDAGYDCSIYSIEEVKENTVKRVSY